MSRIPVLLLKTKSIPNDSYQDHFSTPESPFNPSFVPVLEHQPNETNLQNIKTLLRERRLSERYGGMIFTSQRAVEGFARIVGELEQEETENDIDADRGNPTSTPPVYALAGSFPLYVVGPATERTLGDLLRKSPLLSSLKCKILGRETGSGENLAPFILKHYNHAHYRDYFEFYEAPRLPFVPLVGNRSEQYPRLERGDHRVQKRPLLFLVGETRRDVIPRTLMSVDLAEGERIQVEEVEVYKTGVMASFEEDFRAHIHELMQQGHERIVVVVFSPSGCAAMLNVLGTLDERNQAFLEWRADAKDGNGRRRYVVVTIGPTTRDYLARNFSFKVDVCARMPSPEGISEGVAEFLREDGVRSR